MANATAIKFGHPASLVFETDCWSVLVRPQQPTLGALALVCREPATAFADVSADAYLDLKRVLGVVEPMLKRVVAYERINYVMLMMVDPDVHFHVVPRYDGVREHAGQTFADAGWPGPPALTQAVPLNAETMAGLVATLREAADLPFGTPAR